MEPLHPFRRVHSSGIVMVAPESKSRESTILEASVDVEGVGNLVSRWMVENGLEPFIQNRGIFRLRPYASVQEL